MLELRNVFKSYENQMILKNISFKLEPSEKLSIIGPSGAGKTTILRVINDLAFIDSGDIIVDEEFLIKNGESQKIKAYSKKLGMVFQNYNLFPHMTALENIMSPLINVYNIERKIAEKEALEVLEKVNLLGKKDKYPYELSGGEKQRVAISRAYVLKPKIICLDEPTSALDPESIVYIENLINTLSLEGIGILIISHDMNFAKKVSDRVIFLEEGEIKEILNFKEGQDIENKRVKGFMGLE